MSVTLNHVRCGTDHLPTEPCPADVPVSRHRGPLPCKTPGCGLVYTPGYFTEHVRDYHWDGMTKVEPRDPRDVYGTEEHEAWLIEMERQES